MRHLGVERVAETAVGQLDFQGRARTAGSELRSAQRERVHDMDSGSAFGRQFQAGKAPAILPVAFGRGTDGGGRPAGNTLGAHIDRDRQRRNPQLITAVYNQFAARPLQRFDGGSRRPNAANGQHHFVTSCKLGVQQKPGSTHGRAKRPVCHIFAGFRANRRNHNTVAPDQVLADLRQGDAVAGLEYGSLRVCNP